MESYIGNDINESFVLRAITCCANVLESLHRRWKYGSQTTPAAPEVRNWLVVDDVMCDVIGNWWCNVHLVRDCLQIIFKLLLLIILFLIFFLDAAV